MADAQENVVVRFMAVDVDKVKASFATVEDLCAKLENRVAKLVKTSSTAASSSTKSVETSSKELEKSLDKATRVVDKSAREQVKAVEKAERDKQKAFEKTQKVQEKINAAIVKNAQRAGNEEAKAIKKVNDERIKAEQKAAANVSKSRRSLIGDTGSHAMGTAGRVLGAAGKIIGAGLAVGGGFSAVDSVRSGMAADLSARQMSNDSTDGQGKGRLSVTDIRARSALASKASGRSEEDIIAGMRTVQAKNGNSQVALDSMGRMENGKLVGGLDEFANSSGVDIQTAADLYGNISASQKGWDHKKIMGSMRAIHGASKQGTVEAGAMATQGAKLFALSDSMGGSAEDNMSYLAGMLEQTAVSTGGDAASASTDSKDFFEHMFKNKAKMDPRVKLRDSEGNKLSASQIRRNFHEVYAGREDEAMKVVGVQGGVAYQAAENIRKQGSKAYRERKIAELGDVAGKKFLSSTGGKKEEAAAGMKAFDDEQKKYQDAIVSEGEQRKNAALVMESTTKRLDVAMNNIKLIVGEKMVPAFEKMLPELEKMIPTIGKLVSNIASVANWIAENPFKAAIVACGALMLKSLGEAFAVSKIKSLLSGGAGGGVTGTPGAGGAGGGVLAGGLAIVAGAAVIGMAAGEGINDGTKKVVDANNTARNASLENSSLESRVKNGTATPEEVAKFKKNLQAMKSEQGKGVTDDLGSGFMSGATAGINNLIDGKVTVGNVASVLPQVALIRGVVQGVQEAVTGSTVRGNSKDIDASIKSGETALLSSQDKMVSSLDRVAQILETSIGAGKNTDGVPPMLARE